MATDNSRPNESRRQPSAVGDEGELWFASKLPLGWIWQPPRKDVGKDGLIVIRDDSELHNLEFSVQVKTTMQPRFSEECLVIRNISRSSVLYWMASAHPTLVVGVDLSNDRAYYAWHFDLFESIADVLGESATRISIRIPLENELTTEGWNDIRLELRRCYHYLYNSMSKSDSFVWIVASTGVICNAARNLLKISESPIPSRNVSEEDGIQVLIEQQQHRNVLVVASKLRNGLSSQSKLHHELCAWSDAYERTVRAAFPRIGDVPSEVTNRFGSEVAFCPDELSSSRRKLIFMLFDLVALVTRVHPSGSHNAA